MVVWEHEVLLDDGMLVVVECVSQLVEETPDFRRKKRRYDCREGALRRPGRLVHTQGLI